MVSSPTLSSSTVTFTSAIHGESSKSGMTAPSLVINSSPAQNERQDPRGRSDRKNATSQEHVCVVAFLVREENVHTSAAIEKIQEIRRQFDQAHRRWLPHITLIPPFIVPFAQSSFQKFNDDMLSREDLSARVPKSVSVDMAGKELEEISIKIQEVCDNHVRHTLYMDEIGHFPLRRYRTIHLRPLLSTSNLFEKLQHSLEKAIPQAVENARGKDEKRKKQKEVYKPHLTLGQSYSEDMHTQINKLAGSLLTNGPIKVTVDKIQLMTKPSNQSGPYDVYREFSLHCL